MFILDTLLLSPLYATLWAARQVHKGIQQERAEAPERITAQLSELYMSLDTGRITEQEFDVREKELLDQLDRIQERENPPRAAAKPGKKRGGTEPAPRKQDLAPTEAASAT